VARAAWRTLLVFILGLAVSVPFGFACSSWAAADWEAQVRTDIRRFRRLREFEDYAIRAKWERHYLRRADDERFFKGQPQQVVHRFVAISTVRYPLVGGVRLVLIVFSDESGRVVNAELDAQSRL